jgi:hypothetical protein
MPPWEKYQNTDGPWNKYSSKTNLAAPEKGFFETAKENIGKSWREAQQSGREYNEGKITTPELLLRSTEPAMDVIGEGVRGATSLVPKSARDFISETFAKTPIGQASQLVGAEYQKINQENPRLGKDLKAGGKALGFLAGGENPETILDNTLTKQVKNMMGGVRERVNKISDNSYKPKMVIPKELPIGEKTFAINPKAYPQSINIISDTLKEDGINPLDVAQRLEEAKQSGLPVRAIDVMTKEIGGIQTQGKNSLGLLKGIANLGGRGATMAGNMAARGYTATQRIGDSLEKYLSNQGVYEISDAALQKMKTETPLAYKAAFEGGSVAPLEKQLEKEFSNINKAKSVAQANLAKAKQDLLLITAKESQNSNAYVGSDIIKAKKSAYEAVNKAQKSLESAIEQETEKKDFLKQARLDKKNGAKGAVWSPKIQEMLADDTIQSGIKKGLWIAKKEALANGEKFNPIEYGITGYDESGNPVVSKVPNMRMLDAGKKGLDAIINENKNPLTGAMNETGRAVYMLKSAYLKEIDSLNPDYAKARKIYGSQASQLEAIENGRNFMRMDKEEISKFMNDPETSMSEKAAFAAGVKRSIQEQLESVRDNANPINKIWTQYIRDKVRPVFSNEKEFNKFSKLMEHEQTMARVNSQISGGSQTNMLGNYQNKLSPGKIIKGFTNPAGAAMDYGTEYISKNMQKRMKNLTNENAAILGLYLTTDDPQLWYDLSTKVLQ